MHFLINRENMPNYLLYSCRPVILHFMNDLVHHVLIRDHFNDKIPELRIHFSPTGLFVHRSASRCQGDGGFPGKDLPPALAFATLPLNLSIMKRSRRLVKCKAAICPWCRVFLHNTIEPFIFVAILTRQIFLLESFPAYPFLFWVSVASFCSRCRHSSHFFLKIQLSDRFNKYSSYSLIPFSFVLPLSSSRRSFSGGYQLSDFRLPTSPLPLPIRQRQPDPVGHLFARVVEDVLQLVGSCR